MIDLKQFIQYSDVFIETGTAKGDGVKRALDAGFELVLSVEADIEWFRFVRKRFIDEPRVSLFFGDSFKLLPLMLNLLERCVIILDAHPAGPGTHGHEELMKGSVKHNQDYIITKELTEILRHRNDHLIIIDDQTGFNQITEKYVSLCMARNPEYQVRFEDDGEYKGKYLIFTV